MTERIPTRVCYRHPDRETRLGCSSCGRPICVECSHRASVGQLCPDCVAERGTQRVVGREQIGGNAPGRTPVSMTILGLCVAVFVVGFLSTELRNLLFTYGAQFNRGVAAGELYRLLSAAFLHADIAHIMFNMLALYIFGPQLERQAGGPAFAALYLGSALAGGAAFYLFDPTGAGVAVGASGAIFGLFGAWLAAAYRSRHTAWGQSGFRQLLLLLGINMALPLFIPQIAWQAHLGGLVAGVLIVSLWTLPGVRPRRLARAAVATGVGLVSLALVLVL